MTRSKTYLPKLLLFLIIYVAPLSLAAQQYIEEDFLDNIESNAKSVMDEPVAAFQSNTIPDKWKNESAVVLGYRRSILFDKKYGGKFIMTTNGIVFFFEKVRFKIKLNDKNAVENFSEVYFRYSDREDGFISRIIKSTGEIYPVELKDAVSVEDAEGIPEFFKSFFDQSYGAERRYYKVAIPNLEPGDILEYVANTKSKFGLRGSNYIEFSPQYELCNKAYPVMHNEIIIETDEKTYFNSLSLNGAPEFKKETTEEKGFSRYVFVDKDRATEKDVNFVKEFLVYPLMKFQVIYCRDNEIPGALIGKQGELKKGFSKEELALKAWEDYLIAGGIYLSNIGYGTSVTNLMNSSWEELRKLGAKDWTEKDYIKNVYYYIRNQILFGTSYISDRAYAYYFSALLYQRKIKYDLVITTSNRIGLFKDVLFENEIRYAILVNGQLYFNCTDHSNPGDLVETLLGNEAYIITKPSVKGPVELKALTLPDATAEDNLGTYMLNTSISTDMSNIIVSRTNTYKGISKNRNIDEAMKFTTYTLDDYKNFGGNPPTDAMRPIRVEEYEKSVKALKEELKKAKPDFVKEQLQKEYGQEIVFKDFKMISDGRSLKKSDLVFSEDFELTGMIRKAGKKYLVNLSGLVGPQLQIKKEERERKLDISVGYARTLSWVINFKIPEGYTVEGVKEMNSSVENESGKFSCEAKEENGMVVLNIVKVYKKANISKSKWNEMLAFLDAAYNSSYKYILLKPKS